MARKKLFSVREPAIFFLWFVIGSRYAEPLATRRRSISWSFPSSASRMSFESCCFVSLYGVHSHLTVSASAKHRPPEDAKDEALRIFKWEICLPSAQLLMLLEPGATGGICRLLSSCVRCVVREGSYIQMQVEMKSS